MRARARVAGLALMAGCAPTGSSSGPVAPSPATAETCERLADHLVMLLEADLRASGLSPAPASERRASLKAQCLESGDALTADCLLGARSLEETARCRALDPSREPAPLADEERASPEACERFAAHAVQLLRADLDARGLAPEAADDAASGLRSTCVAEASRAQVECGLAARSVAELEGC